MDIRKEDRSEGSNLKKWYETDLDYIPGKILFFKSTSWYKHNMESHVCIYIYDGKIDSLLRNTSENKTSR